MHSEADVVISSTMKKLEKRLPIYYSLYRLTSAEGVRKKYSITILYSTQQYMYMKKRRP